MSVAVAGASAAAEEHEEFQAVFSLIDSNHQGFISEAALAQALLSTMMVDEAIARDMAARAAADGRKIDIDAFSSSIQEVLEHARSASLASSQGGKQATPSYTVGTALLGCTADLKTFFANTRKDFRLAAKAHNVHEQLQLREEMRRMKNISLRQESEHQDVQEAQMMQAMEFNSAWTQNMAEFERQAREIEEGALRRHEDEFAAFQRKMRAAEPKAFKFSSALLQLKASVSQLAKQGRYEEAARVKAKEDELERCERLKLENDHHRMVANKELALRQQQQAQLAALRRRIQRGREEHKEHWLMGAQRLMQSHRNMLSDLKNKQAIENLKADVAVKLDITSVRNDAAKKKIASNYSDTLPRVDCGRVASSKKPLTLKVL